MAHQETPCARCRCSRAAHLETSCLVQNCHCKGWVEPPAVPELLVDRSEKTAA